MSDQLDDTNDRPQMTVEEFKLFRTMIKKESAIALPDKKLYLVENRLRPLLAEFNITTYSELYKMAVYNTHPLVLQKIIDAIATNETFWFRDKYPFITFEEFFLPVAVKLIKAGRPKVRIWSAATATGQETYSIAMVIHSFLENLKDPAVQPSHFHIFATDISTNALSIARVGAYDQFNMQRGLNTENIERYFRRNGDYWTVDPELKKMIRFSKFNLQDSFGSLGQFDVVFCRNVAIYFSQEFKTELFEKIHKVLQPEGVLFLGATESLSFMQHRFKGQIFKGGAFYQVARG